MRAQPLGRHDAVDRERPRSTGPRAGLSHSRESRSSGASAEPPAATAGGPAVIAGDPAVVAGPPAVVAGPPATSQTTPSAPLACPPQLFAAKLASLEGTPCSAGARG